MVFRADIIASARTPESRRTPLESYAAKGILKSSPGKRRSLLASRRPPVRDRYRGGRDRCLRFSHRFGRARESRNLLHGTSRSRFGGKAFGSRKPRVQIPKGRAELSDRDRSAGRRGDAAGQGGVDETGEARRARGLREPNPMGREIRGRLIRSSDQTKARPCSDL
jgi:hypothetical protein